MVYLVNFIVFCDYMLILDMMLALMFGQCVSSQVKSNIIVNAVICTGHTEN